SVTYPGDTNFNGSATTAPFSYTVNKADSTTMLASSAPTSVFGQPVTFTVTVAAKSPGGGTPTGTVTFVVDGASTPMNLNGSGQATLGPITNLGVSQHTVTASYSGDLNFNTSGTTVPLTQVVNKADTTTSTVMASVASPVFGQQVTYSATVT